MSSNCTNMSDCEPCDYRYALWGMKTGSFFARFEFIQTRTLPSFEMNTISSEMSK